MKRVCVFGIGEAGNLFAQDLVAAGLSVAVYDPAPVKTPEGVERFDEPESAVVGADTVIALTASADAEEALKQAFAQIAPEALYADFCSGSAGLKRRLAARAAERKIAFADIALLAIVPGNGIRTRSMVSGTGADRFVADTPISGAAQIVGGLWIVLGSVLFFGTVVATVTSYFLRPLQRPASQIIDTIEYNLEQLGDLSIEELDLLKETTDTLIDHMERLKAKSLEAR